MPWYRISSLIFAVWGVVFLFFPTFTNELAGIGYADSQHAKDWTQLVGIFCLAFTLLLEHAHRSQDDGLCRATARAVLAVTFPSAVLMTYWQIIPDRQWIRLDIANIALLALMSGGLLSKAQLRRPRN